MAKRGKSSKKASASHRSQANTIKLLLENNIVLQSKMVDLTISIDDMNKKFGKLLGLIEKASESFAKGDHAKEDMGEGALVNKLEGLIQQNKTIARGLILLEKYVRDKTVGKREKEQFEPLPEFKFGD